jgi:hypothetical protein
MKSATFKQCLDAIDGQREVVFARLNGISSDELWERPRNGRWSIGQNLEHLAKAMRTFRWVFALAYPLGLPFAAPFRRRQFARDIANPYADRPKPVNAPPGVRPRDRQTAPASLEQLLENKLKERQKFHNVLRGMHESIAGHIKVWDPPVGMVNLLQLARLVTHHEAHHFRFVHDLLDKYDARRANRQESLDVAS